MEISHPIKNPQLVPRTQNPFGSRRGLRNAPSFQNIPAIKLLDMADPPVLNIPAIQLLKKSCKTVNDSRTLSENDECKSSVPLKAYEWVQQMKGSQEEHHHSNDQLQRAFIDLTRCVTQNVGEMASMGVNNLIYLCWTDKSSTVFRYRSKSSVERNGNINMFSHVTHVALMAKTKPLLVIAIDIGSYASGYAWLWRWEYENTPLEVRTNPNWKDGSRVSQKTMTALLLKPDKTIAAFGYVAIEMMCTLDQEHTDHEDWYFFRGFKMTLHSKKEGIDFNQTIEDYKGRHLPASFVFGCVVKYFKDHALRHFKVSNAHYTDEEVKWVVTIPAIWTDTAKSIMREAARQADIRDSNLTIALEPECAAIYCQKLPRGQFLINAKNADVKYAFEPGSTVMVVDMGGGTVDITIVEINEDFSLKHVHKSGGGAWGGMRVNDEVFKLLKGVFGHEVFDTFQDKNKMEFVDIQMDIETQKRQVGFHDKQEHFRVKVSPNMFSSNNEQTKETVDAIMQESGISFLNSRLNIPLKKVLGFFDIVIADILEFITDIIGQIQLINRITAVIVVGGFANSDYVTESISNGLKGIDIPVIRPDDAELSILKGAVLFGHNEAIVTSRIMPRTYGVACTMEYDKNIHNKKFTFKDGGKVWANNVFRKHVTIGQSVKCGEWIVDMDYYPVDANQTVATIYLFSSDKTDPYHTTDEGCIFIGQFDVDFPPCDEERNDNRAVIVTMRFGGTEIEVKATNNTTGKTYFKYLKA